ncbi:MAG: hypothetical protein ACI3YS_08785 [Prevotella sp.]
MTNMNIIEDFDMRLELFLKNKMTEEEGKAFLSELQSDPELRVRAQTMAAAIKNMKELKYEYSQRVASKIECLSEREYRKIAKLPKKASIISLRSFVRMGIAACFVGVISFGAYRYYLYNETIALGNSYYSEVPTELVVRGTDNVSQQLSHLFTNVKNNKDLDNTILDLEDKFSLAISNEFNEYINYMNDIGWNLAIAYLKDGDREKAVKTLELLISHSESDIIIEKCKKLIVEINQL